MAWCIMHINIDWNTNNKDVYLGASDPAEVQDFF